MSSGWLESRRIRFDTQHDSPGSGPRSARSTVRDVLPDELHDQLQRAIGLTQDHLLSIQATEGYWVGELEGDTILESEYILLLAFLDGWTDGSDRRSAQALLSSESRHFGKARRAANYIRTQQLPTGGWAIYPGGPLEISASVKSYFALKLMGDSPDAEHMVRARQAILKAGGVEKVNSFTRYYLALLGVITYAQCPAVPPELILIPKWAPLNLYEMSSWSRTIVVPLSLLWAFKPAVQVPTEQNIRELFVKTPEELSMSMGPSSSLDSMSRRTRIDWARLFRVLDRAFKLVERCGGMRPFRKRAIRRAEAWMLERFEDSDGLGAIFPPIIWSAVALRCLGYAEDTPEVQSALKELDKLVISEGDADRLQPCKSPVWDTAISLLALRDADVPSEHPAIQQAVKWLLSKEVRRVGDWAARDGNREPAGWFFEFRNAFYPDVDDTGMVLMALNRCLPENRWSTDFLIDDWSPHEADKDAAAVLAGRTRSSDEACAQIESLQPVLSAIRRGARWVLDMQSRDGGWGAFDVNNDREIFTQVPFADHNAMIDPSTSDLTARMIEMFARLNVPQTHPAIQQALDFVWSKQEPDHSWYGRWGVNYIYGTWQALVGLTAIGIPPNDSRIRGAARWLRDTQQSCGGWGETPGSYDDPSLRGQGPPTASQTAWALMGLMAAGEVHSSAVRRGVQYLLDTQLNDGTWQEDWYTGTGFPRVFYLKYNLYRIYFPLMALGRYRRLRNQRTRST